MLSTINRLGLVLVIVSVTLRIIGDGTDWMEVSAALTFWLGGMLFIPDWSKLD